MYQIYAERNGRLELDGCWGSEYALFSDQAEAERAAKCLAANYPDCGWVVKEVTEQ